MSTLTIKVPAATARWLDERARATQRTKSAIVRDAIDRLRADLGGRLCARGCGRRSG